jgi:M6 family metalloprotease-like protein
MRARHFFAHRHRLLLTLAAVSVLVAVPIAGAAGSGQTGTFAKARAAMTKASKLVGPMPADLASYWAKRPYTFAHPNPEAQWRQQPDGRGFLVRVVPFEAGGGLETVTGHAVIQGKGGWWYYAVRGKDRRMHATKHVVQRDEPLTKPGANRLSPRVLYTTEKELPQMRARLAKYLAKQYRTMATETAKAGVPVTIKIPAFLFTVNQENFQPDSTPEKFERLLSGEGTSPTGTLTEMYKEQSHGQMILDFDVYGPYQSALSLAHNCWYGTDGGPVLGELLGLGGLGARGMAAEATPQADPFVNFGQYDNDNNGFVDFLLMIHSGADAAHTGDPCDVWSHYWAGLGEPIQTTDLNSEGEPVRIGPVMTVPEIDAAIGVTAHELMHALGEPDFYDTKTTQTGQGTGDWDLGAGGSWSGIPAQTNPIHFNPLMKVNKRWIEPRVITATQLGVTLRPRASYPDLVAVPVYIAPVGHADNAQCNKAPLGIAGQNAAFKLPDGSCMVEGFLIENLSRTSAVSDSQACVFQPADFDRQAYASGLAIWHWDFRSYASNANTANQNNLRYAVDLEEFDRRDARQELQTNITRGEPLDLFWGDPVGITGATQNNANITERQHGPVGTRTNDGVQTGWAFTNITPNDYSGLAHGGERAGGVITLDLVKHDATTVDVSGDFARVVAATPTPVRASTPVNMQTVVYNHGGRPADANLAIYSASPNKSAPFLSQTVSLAGFDRKVISFTFTPKRGLNSIWVKATAAGDVTPGNDTVRSEITAHRNTAADVLIVDNDRGMTQEEGFEALLQGLGVGYHVVEGEPAAATMTPYKGVIWLTSSVSGSNGIISAAGRTALASYMDGGGKVWFSSSRAMGYLGITQGQGSFLAKYFGLTAVGNMLGSAGTLTGLGDAEIGGTRSIALGFMDYKPYLDFGTLAASGVSGTATALFAHSTKPANIVGTKVVGTSGFRTVYTPPLQIIGDARERATLGREVLTFLGVQLGKVNPDTSAIKHERYRHIQVGQDLPFVVGAAVDKGAVASVDLLYRTYGKTAWKTLRLTSVGDGLYGGTIPGAEIHNNGLEYYVRAKTANNKTLTTANSSALPDVASAPYGDPAPGPYGACGG